MSRSLKSANRPSTNSKVDYIDKLPERLQDQLYVYDLEEEKHRFLRLGIMPKLRRKFFYVSPVDVHFEYLPEATYILEEAKRVYGDGESYMEHAYGKKIDLAYATNYLLDYIKIYGADGIIDIIWTTDLACSGKMSWYGPNARFNRPEARKFCLCIKDSQENTFLRQKGIRGFAHHEIGTHYLRTLNDGVQPWFSSRATFNLRGSKSRETQITEEGLAAINALIDTDLPLLFMAALLYYTACKATEMNFMDLFQHLSIYVRDEEQRWKHVMRVKRTLDDCSGIGGNGNDQCYFQGAVDILRSVNKIDFNLLYAGKIGLEELKRVRRIARLGTVRLPRFMRDLHSYQKKLERMAQINGILVFDNISKGIRMISKSKAKKGHQERKSETRLALDEKCSRAC